MSPLENVLRHLDKPKKSGKGFTARCPAHEDRGPSLSITEGDDGRVLMHCFAGCRTSDVATAIGLTLVDLFPPSNQPRLPLPAPGVSRSSLRAAAEFEGLVLRVIKFDRMKGKSISAADLERERIARRRIAMARRALA